MSRKALFTADLLAPVIDAARAAGVLIMRHYKGGGAVDRKSDASPVTEADREADHYIVTKLLALAPETPIVSEEGKQPVVAGADHFWLVDPLDGTKSFIRGSGYFTVNIALIDGATKLPILGVIYDPANDVMYYGSSEGAFRIKSNGAAEPIRGRTASKKLTALVSHSHLNTATEEYLSTHSIDERVPCASSIKFCFLAEGKADFYPRFGPTMEWDTAAGHAILAAAGGSMSTPQGAPFLYGKPGFTNGNFIASASR